MNKGTLVAISALGGLLSATLGLLPLISLPVLILLSYFISLPLFLLGLGLGLRPLLGAGFLATVIIFSFEGPILAAEFFFFSFLAPAFLIHRALLSRKKSSEEVTWYPPSFLLRDFTLLSGIIMLFVLGLYIYFTQGENPVIFAKKMLLVLDPHKNIPNAESLLIKIFPFLPGLFTFSWMLMMVFNAAIAQGFLAHLRLNLRPTPSFKAIQIPKNFLIVLTLSLVLSFIGVGTLELLGKNAALILAFPFFFSGLGIVHILLHKTAFAKIGLIIFYTLLLTLIWPAFIVICLGMLKPWIEKPIPSN